MSSASKVTCHLCKRDLDWEETVVVREKELKVSIVQASQEVLKSGLKPEIVFTNHVGLTT